MNKDQDNISDHPADSMIMIMKVRVWLWKEELWAQAGKNWNLR